MTLIAGTKLGRYEIRSKIGAGGMGEVYLAYDKQLDRTLALMNHWTSQFKFAALCRQLTMPESFTATSSLRTSCYGAMVM